MSGQRKKKGGGKESGEEGKASTSLHLEIASMEWCVIKCMLMEVTPLPVLEVARQRLVRDVSNAHARTHTHVHTGKPQTVCGHTRERE